MISVIIPIYNAEKFIQKCIDSVLAQSYKDFELILVDDGSQDFSASICDEFAKFDRRIKVIHQLNGGEASARNTGLKNSEGQYIAFVDSDDYVDTDYLNTLYDLHIKYKADYVSCQCRYLQLNGDIFIHKQSPKEETEILINLDTADYSSWYLSGGVWCRLYRKDIIDKFNLSFDLDYKIGCDYVFNMQYLSHVGVAVATSKCAYTYVQQETSIMHTANIEAGISGMYATEAGRQAISMHKRLSNQVDMMNIIRTIEYLQRNDVKNAITQSQRQTMLNFVKEHMRGKKIDFKIRLFIKGKIPLMAKFLNRLFKYDLLKRYRN